MNLRPDFKALLPVLVLVPIVWTIYFQTLGFSYVWDDGIIFLDKNDLVVDPLSWKLLSQPVLDGTSYLRPLVFFTWFSEFKIFGQNPFVSHFVNVSIFCCNVILVYVVSSKLFGLLKCSCVEFRGFVAALIYAVHPALIEVAAWVAGRFDLMCTMFVLLAFVAYFEERAGLFIKSMLLVVFQLMALFSKELGVVLPVLLFGISVAIHGKGGGFVLRAIYVLKEKWILFLAMAVAIIFYLVVRSFSVGGVYHAPLTVDYLKDVFKFGVPFRALREYVLVSILPFGRVDIFYPIGVFDFGSSVAWVVDGAVVFVLAGSFYLAVVRNIFFGWLVFSFFISIFLVLQVVPMTIGDNLIQCRFLSLPLVFVCIMVASISPSEVVDRIGGVRSIKAVKFCFWLAGFGWVVLAAFVCLTTIPVWKNSLSLWAWARASNSDVAAVRHNYIQAALVEGRFDLVEKEFNRILKKEKGLGVGEQILYSNFLIRKGDSEALNYLEGLVYTIPDFRVIPDGRKKIFDYSLSPLLIAGLFVDYANAKIVFSGDFAGAEKYNKVAEWYLRPSEMYTVLFQRAAIYMASGRFLDGKEILLSMRGVYVYKKDSQIRAVVSATRVFCSKAVQTESVKKGCSEFEKEFGGGELFGGEGG